MNNKKKNPLYVVTNKGKDVEQAKSWFDGLIKKLGLSGAINSVEQTVNSLIEMLVGMVKDYALFVAVKNILDEIVVKLEQLLKFIYPQAFFYKA